MTLFPFSFGKIVFFVLAVLFSVIIIHNFFTNIKWFKEPFYNLYPENAAGDKEDDPDDEFFKKMNSEILPTSEDIEIMAMDLDKEVVLSPEEQDFMDENDIELPETNPAPNPSFTEYTEYAEDEEEE